MDEPWKQEVVCAERNMAQRALDTLLYILTETNDLRELSAMSGRQIVDGVVAYRDRHRKEEYTS